MTEKIIGLIAEQLGVSADTITTESLFVENLGADSLDMVEMIMLLEEEFGLEIADEDAEAIKTVGDAIEYIKANAK